MGHYIKAMTDGRGHHSVCVKQYHGDSRPLVDVHASPEVIALSFDLSQNNRWPGMSSRFRKDVESCFKGTILKGCLTWMCCRPAALVNSINDTEVSTWIA